MAQRTSKGRFKKGRKSSGGGKKKKRGKKRKSRFKKGSRAAKAYMASIRPGGKRRKGRGKKRGKKKNSRKRRAHGGSSVLARFRHNTIKRLMAKGHSQAAAAKIVDRLARMRGSAAGRAAARKAAQQQMAGFFGGLGAVGSLAAHAKH